MKYNPTCKKIGKVIYAEKEYPIWMDNSIAQDIISINIVDNGYLNEYLWDELGFKKKFTPSSPGTYSNYYFTEIEKIRDKLKELNNHFKAEIDWDNVEEFLFKIEKLMAVRRLGGNKE